MTTVWIVIAMENLRTVDSAQQFCSGTKQYLHFWCVFNDAVTLITISQLFFLLLNHWFYSNWQHVATCSMLLLAVRCDLQHVATCSMLLLATCCDLQRVVTCNMFLLATCFYLQCVATCSMLLLATCCYLQYVATCNVLLLATCCCFQYVETYCKNRHCF